MPAAEHRFYEVFDGSSIFRDVQGIYRFWLYFNLPYDSIVSEQIAPVLVKEVSNENEEEKTSISALLKEFADEDPLEELDDRLQYLAK